MTPVTIQRHEYHLIWFLYDCTLTRYCMRSIQFFICPVCVWNILLECELLYVLKCNFVSTQSFIILYDELLCILTYSIIWWAIVCVHCGWCCTPSVKISQLRYYHLIMTKSNVLCVFLIWSRKFVIELCPFVLARICSMFYMSPFLNVRNCSRHLIVDFICIIYDFDKTCILSCCIITRGLLPWQQ